MKDVNVLLVWTTFPEECELYLLTIDATEAAILKTADDKLINSSEPTPGLNALNYATVLR